MGVPGFIKSAVNTAIAGMLDTTTAKSSSNISSNYLDKNRTLVTITTIGGNPHISVKGVIPAEYGFTVKNDFQALLTTNPALADFQKAGNAINQLVGNTGMSVVPYSPMIWMGADPPSISELVLQFVAYADPHLEVHVPLMNLLAMGLPTGHGGSLGGVKGGMLLAPPSVEVKIGKVINWKPCFIQNVSIVEKAPYTKDGYGMTGEAKIQIIRRDYMFAGDFK